MKVAARVWNHVDSPALYQVHLFDNQMAGSGRHDEDELLKFKLKVRIMRKGLFVPDG